MRTMLPLGAAIAAGALTIGARASVPTYTGFQLQARANFAGAFNLPNSAFFTNATPAINDAARIALKLEVIGGSDSQGVWHGGNGAPTLPGGIVYTTPADGVISDPGMNNLDIVAANQFFTTPSAIIRINALTQMSSIGVATGGFFGLTALSGSLIDDDGVIGFRGTQGIGGQAFISDLAGSQLRHVAEVGADPGSPYSFLFTPAMNENRQIAGKARRGALNQVAETQPDEVRIWNGDGSSILIAEDRESQGMTPTSPFSRFDNSVAINDSGWVAFTSTLFGGGRGVYLGNGSTTIEIANTNLPAAPGRVAVTEVEFFRPDVNNVGVVVFRGRDAGGLRAIFVGDGTRLIRLIGEHDLMPSDLGTARIDQNDASPVFGGSPSINSRGDVAFQCTLTPPGDNQVEWGSGAYVAYAAEVGDLNGDGTVGSGDLALLLGAWGPCPAPPTVCVGDLDGDGAVGSADLALLLGNWG